jgi:hypothetical protein
MNAAMTAYQRTLTQADVDALCRAVRPLMRPFGARTFWLRVSCV